MDAIAEAIINMKQEETQNENEDSEGSSQDEEVDPPTISECIQNRFIVSKGEFCDYFLITQRELFKLLKVQATITDYFRSL